MGSKMIRRKHKDSLYFKDEALRLLNHTIYPMVFGLIGFACGLGALAYVVSIQGKSVYVPYLVTVDKSGSILASGELEENMEISDAALANFICEYIEKLYSIVSDPQTQINLIKSVYARTDLQSFAQKSIDEFYSKENVLEGKGKKKREVKILSIVRLSKKCFQVDFLMRSILNDKTVEEHYKAEMFFTTRDIRYLKLNDLRLNPLGIFITEFNVSKKIEDVR